MPHGVKAEFMALRCEVDEILRLEEFSAVRAGKRTQLSRRLIAPRRIEPLYARADFTYGWVRVGYLTNLEN